MSLSINTVTHGYSQTGAAEFVNQIHQEAIVETKNKLGQIEKIRSTIEEGWQGQAELNFMTNFQNGVKAVQNALDELDARLTEEFNTIGETWVEQDRDMVQVDE